MPPLVKQPLWSNDPSCKWQRAYMYSVYNVDRTWYVSDIVNKT